MRKLLLAVLLAAGTAVPAAAQQGSDADRREVLAVVQRLFDAMRTRDSAAMRTAVFDPSARLYAVRTRQGQAAIVATPWEQFAASNARDTANVWDERHFDPEVRIDGPLAQVWTYYEFYRGTTFSHCGIDAIELLKGPAGWRIVALADTFRREGCRNR